MPEYLNLKMLRTKHSMSQPTVAKILGISSVAYSHKETGRTPFTLPEAKLLADTFDVTIDELFYGKVHVSHN